MTHILLALPLAHLLQSYSYFFFILFFFDLLFGRLIVHTVLPKQNINSLSNSNNNNSNNQLASTVSNILTVHIYIYICICNCNDRICPSFKYIKK